MRTKIAALITALLIIFVGAGGIYFISRSDLSPDQSQQEEALPETRSVRIPEETSEPVDTRIEDWFKQLGQELGLETLNIEESSFEWALEEEIVEATGQSLVMEQVDQEILDKVLGLFEQNDFEQDAYNLALDETVEIYGFKKNDLVCLLRSSAVPETDTSVVDLRITCSLLEPSAMASDSQENAIKQLFAQKYDRDTSTINVDIIQSTSEHMSGSVQFIEPDEDQPTPGNVGGFLAAVNEDGEWVLVFDGNGAIFCSAIEPFDFPVEMVPECYDDAAGQLIDRT